MHEFWQQGRPLTVREVLSGLDATIAYTTAITVIERLRSKGWLTRERAGRAFLYVAVHDASDYAAQLMNGALDEVDDRGAALLNFAGRLTPTEADQLRRALDVNDST